MSGGSALGRSAGVALRDPLGMGRTGEAGPYLRDAVVNLERLLGEQHFETGNVWSSFGAYYEASGKYKEAERWYRKAIANLNAAVGPDHPKTKNAQENPDTLLAMLERE